MKANAKYNQHYVYGNPEGPKINDANLVAHIRFNGNFEDSKGCNCGTLTGCTTFSTAPLFNGMLQDQCNYVELANECNFDFGACSAMSVAFWVKPNTGGGGQDLVVSKREGITSDPGWSVHFNNGCTRMQYEMGSSTSEIAVTTDDCAFPFCVWTHFAVSKDASGNENGINIYVNGVLDRTGACDTICGTALNCLPVRIGANSVGTQLFSGCISDVRIFNDELTSTEVSQIYIKGKQKALEIDPALEARIEFDRNVCCYAGNTNHGSWNMCPSYGCTSQFYRSGVFTGCDATFVDLANECNFDCDRCMSFSFSFWTKTDTFNACSLSIASKRQGLNEGWLVDFRLDCGVGPRLLIEDSCTNIISKGSDCCIRDGNWHHSGITYDGTSTVCGINIYKDGVIASCTTDFDTDTLVSTILNDNTLRLGGRNNCQADYIGEIDDFRYYKRILTAAEVQVLFERR